MRDPAVKQSLGIKIGLDKSTRLAFDTGRPGVGKAAFALQAACQ